MCKLSYCTAWKLHNCETDLAVFVRSILLPHMRDVYDFSLRVMVPSIQPACSQPPVVSLLCLCLDWHIKPYVNIDLCKALSAVQQFVAVTVTVVDQWFSNPSNSLSTFQ